jgi:hypothetical protein
MKKLLLIGYLITLISCKKTDTTPITPVKLTGTYVGDGQLILESFTLYTSGSTITDTSLIKNFVARYLPYEDWPAWRSIKPGSTAFNYYNAGPLNFNADTATQTRSTYPPKGNYNVTYKNANTVLLTARDLSSMKSADAGQLSCTNLGIHVRKYQPAFTCNVGSCAGYEQTPLTIHKDFISYPCFNYFFARPNIYGGYCTVKNVLVFDLFNESIRSQLLPKDTLLIQMCSFKMYKQ